MRSTEPRTRVSAVAGFDPYRGRTTFAPAYCTHADCPHSLILKICCQIPQQELTTSVSANIAEVHTPAASRNQLNVSTRPGHSGTRSAMAMYVTNLISVESPSERTASVAIPPDSQSVLRRTSSVLAPY